MTAVGPGGTTNKDISFTLEVAPTIDFHRTCNDGINTVECTTVKPGDIMGVSWTTSGVTSLTYTCNIPPTNPYLPPLNQNPPAYRTYDELTRQDGWTAGLHVCEMVGT